MVDAVRSVLFSLKSPSILYRFRVAWNFQSNGYILSDFVVEEVLHSHFDTCLAHICVSFDQYEPSKTVCHQFSHQLHFQGNKLLIVPLVWLGHDLFHWQACIFSSVIYLNLKFRYDYRIFFIYSDRLSLIAQEKVRY